ncbi:SDR family oxidoreductase [Buttiauxella selenatireducens]|uniref:SDR family oxidoreductase n=1 Tax=Buttiauxella selenatireducens TaxID=3073902 RepID=A0ABY9S522_9ENTR|nr:SDR family NAD(P)-dependent oxidoreductase [Buttiauxella sp. R73]WMY72599.1 SDR family oxidoreductase [Buttiauxella sp. R73]
MKINLFDLTGKTALVTGGSRGLGLAMARGLGLAGARIILNGRNVDALHRSASALCNDGIEVQISPFDVTNPDAVNRAIAEIENTQPVDILLNNAGMQYREALETFPVDQWQRVMNTNCTSAFLVGQAVARGMIARRQGKIINICSLMSELGRPGIAPYAASKGAVKMLTRGMCTDWAQYNIQVNGIGPGYFRTEMNIALSGDPAFSDWLCKRTPAGRWGEADELTGAAVFLASSAANFVNGQILYVDGGLSACV